MGAIETHFRALSSLLLSIGQDTSPDLYQYHVCGAKKPDAQIENRGTWYRVAIFWPARGNCSSALLTFPSTLQDDRAARDSKTSCVCGRMCDRSGTRRYLQFAFEALKIDDLTKSIGLIHRINGYHLLDHVWYVSCACRESLPISPSLLRGVPSLSRRVAAFPFFLSLRYRIFG